MVINFDKPIILDGAMGTMLYSIKGLKFTCPEEVNITHPNIISDIHRQYISSGAIIIQTNTFGANREKLRNFNLQDKIEYINRQALKSARQACQSRALVAVSLGPTGKLVEPFGDSSFDTIYNIYKEQAAICLKEEPDLFIIETMSQINEAKAAILAVKDICSLPIFCTMTFEDNNKTLMGTSPEAALITLQALGISGFGVNCSNGPKSSLDAIKSMAPFAKVPLIAQPNGGIPMAGALDLQSPDMMLKWYLEINKAGAAILGGCCGTNPEHIKALSQNYSLLNARRPLDSIGCIATSNWDFVKIKNDQGPVIIGERINPTGKAQFTRSLTNKDYSPIIIEALEQQKCGCHILDVNVSVSQGDEVELLSQASIHIQNSSTVPLQFDSLNINALEKALKVYSGRAIINSTTAQDNSLDKLLTLTKRYGAVIIGLTMEDHIPKGSQERLALAKKIITRGESHNLSKDDIIIDPLITSTSSDYSPYTALEAARLIKDELGYTIMGGISNCSFGMPQRESLNRAMAVLALNYGFDALIINPKDEELMNIMEASYLILSKGQSLHRYLNLNNRSNHIDYFKENSLSSALFMGNLPQALELLRGSKKDINKIITDDIIPVFEILSELYEKGDIYLPHLLSSSRVAAEVINTLNPQPDLKDRDGKILLATVEGDYHDIGKSIASLLLKANGFDVIDLGKGVMVDIIVEQIKSLNISLVGLSCLMTSTLPSLENTVNAILHHCPNTKIMAGGAVLSEDYCKKIGVHYFCPRAIDGLKIAKAFFHYR